MSTRSDIIVEHGDGTWKRIYCHWDGYPEHNGRILQDHYNSQERAELVVKPGDMSSLDARCDKPRGHSFNKRVEGCTVYYGRDRGEKNVAGVTGASLAEVWPGDDTDTEYTYVWRIGEGWLVGDADEGQQSLQTLAEVLAGGNAPKTEHKGVRRKFRDRN